ncbi:MAG: hypothetical protein A3F11_12090 [Gammaproteobacteria bacterium RIFCSPHIGHO2_12_FULL_37_14]|nr:MAG: hypothetical protein A3F11_12090 [Gammaproteobacteria bacterium RIFCSPHIGHO2_12_FULL_37_14]
MIGGIECLFTANLAQAACDGFGKVMDNKAKLSRSLKLEYPADFPFFHSDLGRAHFVYSYYGHALLVANGREARPGAAGRVQNLCRAKTSNLQDLCNRQIAGRRHHGAQ